MGLLWVQQSVKASTGLGKGGVEDGKGYKKSPFQLQGNFSPAQPIIKSYLLRECTALQLAAVTNAFKFLH